MEETTYYGTHVNLTARLEPIVQRGQVFVTEAFAASLTSEGAAGFRCNYIGAMALARRFSDARLYRLQRAAGSGARPSDKMRDSIPSDGPKP